MRALDDRTLSLDGVAADLRQAVRSLRASPTFTIGALLVLAVGIGATTAIYSIVDAVVLRGLPFDDADRIVAVGERSLPKKGGAGPRPLPKAMAAAIGAGDPQALGRVQPQNYLDWVAQQQAFESIAAIAGFDEDTLQLAGGEPETVVKHRVTASFFDVIRVKPAIGQAFTSGNEVEGRDRVVLLSDAFWQRRFGADAGILGRTLLLNGTAHEVIGVMPPGFTYPVGDLRPAEMWVPYVVPANERTRGHGFSLYLQCIARLKPGLSLAQAQTQMEQVALAIEQANPATNAGSRIGLRPLRDHIVGASTKSWMLMLLAAVGIVLVIACVNAANLWLARASVRERDVAVRSALGASRWRLIRQWLVESLLVSTLGTLLGLGLAWPLVHVLRASMPDTVGRVASISLDWRILAVSASLGLLTGVLSGIVPAIQASRVGLAVSLNQTPRSGVSRGPQRLRSALVVVEVALAVVLVVGAGLFIGSFVNVMRVDLGFRSEGVLTMQIFPRMEPGSRSSADLGPAFAEVAERVRRIGGIAEVAAASPGIPLRVNGWFDALKLPGTPIDRNSTVSIKVVTPAYHRALTIPLRAGRLFDENDRDGSQKVVLLTDAAVRQFFGGRSPVGQTVVVNRADRTVVGVVADARQSSLEIDPMPEVYLPMAQAQVRSGYLVIRTHADPYDALPAVRSTVAQVFPHDPMRYVATMDEMLAAQTAARRLNMLMLSVFGALGLVISAIGVFGVMAFLVTQRTREIGVRMALGATRSRVVGMILKHALGLVVLGVAAGGTAAWYLAGTARAFLFGVDAHDPRAFVVPVVTLVIAAILASVLPARRAASVDPTVALRSE